MINRIRALLDNLLRKDQIDHDLDEELDVYVELASAERVSSGMSPDEAYRQTRREMGGVDQVRQRVRDIRAGALLERLAQDIRYSVRTLAKNPAFSLVVVATLALGIGANAAIFSIINAVLLRPLPYANPVQLVTMSESLPKAGVTNAGMSWAAFTTLHDHNGSFSSIAGLATHSLTLTGSGEPTTVSTVSVTGDFFSLFGTQPLLGRTLVAADVNDGAAPVLVLSDHLWRSRFGADPNIVGRAVGLDQHSFTVAGVMPASFQTPFVGKPNQVWIPLVYDPLFSKWRTRPQQTHWLPALARLRPGVSIGEAQAELQTVAASLTHQFPQESGWQPDIHPLQQEIAGDVKTPLLVLLAAASLVFLIACFNIANLLLARATTRSKEMAVRIAVGATRSRIASQLLTEGAVLGLLGCVLGVLFAWGSVTAFSSTVPTAVPRLQPIRVDGAVLGFALVLSLAASLLFGLAPVLFTSRSNPQADLRDGSRTGEARRSQRARSILAAAEVAVAMVLLAGAGLLLRSFVHLLQVSPGFETEHLVKAEISLPRYQYAKPEQWSAFMDEFMTRLLNQHGFEKSAIGLPLPILDNQVDLPFAILGKPPQPQGKANMANYVSASPQYFPVMGISLIRGRLFSAEDTAMTQKVAVISLTLAHRYFPNEDPLGKHLVFGFAPNVNVSREIVGIVADIHNVSLAKDPGPIMYVPFVQEPFWGGEIVVKGNLSVAEVENAIRATTRGIDASLPVTEVETLPEALNASVAEPRFRTLLLVIFGIIALLLATVGIYGVISYSVSRRTREIGVRMALGATPTNLCRLILGESAKLTLFGLTAGIPAALASARLLSGMLFAVNSADPTTFLGVALLLMIVALAAAYFPARRAMRVDPARALRWE
jgi:putative ABC transport system permease protein